MKNLKIAIDGFSSTGKSTFAKMIAARYGLVYVDSGAIYRTVTYAAMKQGLKEPFGSDLREIEKLLSEIRVTFERSADNRTQAFLNGENVETMIRSMEVSNRVSAIAAIPQVRSYVNDLLKRFGNNGGIVMDGRDIGTVVMPNADIKIFMTASDEVRAQRRYEELKAKGNDALTFEEVLENLRTRDRIDSSREVDPLRKADDARVLDNSSLSLEEQMQWVDSLLK